MPIDQYQHSFMHLANSDIPKHMAQLKESMKSPNLMSDFSVNGVGVSSLCRSFSLESDFPGCYVMMEDDKPIYVGISKAVLQRLRQHVRGTTHFDASLAYRIAKQQMPHEHTRAKAMETEKFKKQFDSAKDYIKSLKVGYVKIINPLTRYIFEPYCAMEFDTSTWNTFETH